MRTDTRIETGRSWRDLPSSPPASAPPVDAARAPVDGAPPPDAPGHPGRRWAVAVVALAAGMALGAWSPWTTAPATEDPAADLPETIVPPPRSTTPDAPQPDPFGGGPGGGLTIPFEGLVRVAEPPAGYGIHDTAIQLTPEGLQQITTLRGPEGDVTISATLAAGRADAGEGDEVRLRGTTGRLSEDGDRRRLSWVEQGLIEVVIDAPSALGSQWLVDLAESLEVAP